MQKHCEPPSPPKIASPRRLRSSTTAAANSTPSSAFPKPLETSHELITRLRKAQERNYAAENEHSRKRLRKNSPSVSVPSAASQDLIGVWQARGNKRQYDFKDQHVYKRRCGSVLGSQLSEENLKNFERYLQKLEGATPNEMDPNMIVPDRVLKRGPSRQASLSDLNQDTASLRSQKSSVSNRFYRYWILDQARMYVCPEPPPMDIQAQMNVIFERDIPEKKRQEISGIAKKISEGFIDKLRGAYSEDDLVELIYGALCMMQKDETFDFLRKAGSVPPLTSMYSLLRANAR